MTTEKQKVQCILVDQFHIYIYIYTVIEILKFLTEIGVRRF